MANVKISELPAATYVAPTSQVPVVFSGITKRSTVSQINPLPSIKQFGAVGDGVTDDTAAFVSALANTSYPGVYMPNGTYLVSQIAMPPGTQLIGESQTGTIIKFTGAQAKGLITNNQGTSTFYNYNTLKNFSLDMSLLPNLATSFGVYFYKSWGNLIENVSDARSPAGTGNSTLPSSAFSFGSGTGLYTTVFNNCDLKALSFTGASGSDRVTTLTFCGLSTQYVNLDTVTAINFYGCTWQGSYAAKLDMTVANRVNVIGGDIEGTGVAFRFNGGNCTDNMWNGVDFAGFSGTTTSGTNTITSAGGSGPTAFSSALATGNITTGRTTIRVGTLTSVSTGATTIYTANNASAAIEVDIFGDDGSSGWMDRVVYINAGTPVRVTTATLYGSPPTRTYTSSTTSLQLALSAGTHNVRAFPIEMI